MATGDAGIDDDKGPIVHGRHPSDQLVLAARQREGGPVVTLGLGFGGRTDAHDGSLGVGCGRDRPLQ